MSRMVDMLRLIADGQAIETTPYSRVEMLLKAIANQEEYNDPALSRIEALLKTILDQGEYNETPQSEIERVILSIINGEAYEGPISSDLTEAFTEASTMFYGNASVVKYYNWDGTVLLKTESVVNGRDARYEVPHSRQDTPQYSYSFIGWAASPNAVSADANILRNITENIDVYEVYSQAIKSYPVRFYSGSTIIQQSMCQYGSYASYDAADPSSNPVTEATEYHALFSVTATIYYFSQDGRTLLDTETVIDGAAPIKVFTHSKASTAQYDYTYEGWSDTADSETAVNGILDNVLVSKNVYEAFSKTVRNYVVRFYNGTSILQEASIPYGSSITYDSDTYGVPTKEGNDRRYAFREWLPLANSITGPVNCYAQYDSYATIRYYSYDGNTLIDSEEVMNGASPVKPSSMTHSKEQTAQYTYAFDGWNTQPSSDSGIADVLSGVMANIDVYEAFAPILRSYAVRFLDGNGTTVLQTKQVEYGSQATYTGSATPTYGDADLADVMEFDEWDNTSPIIEATDISPLFTFIGNVVQCYLMDKLPYYEELVEADANTSIGNFVFAGTTKLRTVRMPYLQNCGSNIFKGAVGLYEVYVPNLSHSGDYFVTYNDVMEKLVFPSIPNVLPADVPVCEGMGALKELRFPNFTATLFHAQTYNVCNNLELIDFGFATDIQAYLCSSYLKKLKTLIFRNTETVATLVMSSNKYFDTSSPIYLKSSDAKILVPRTMVDTYKADSIFSEYASIIFALEDYPEIANY